MRLRNLTVFILQYISPRAVNDTDAYLPWIAEFRGVLPEAIPFPPASTRSIRPVHRL